jgi:hypothetical protein
LITRIFDGLRGGFAVSTTATAWRWITVVFRGVLPIFHVHVRVSTLLSFHGNVNVSAPSCCRRRQCEERIGRRVVENEDVRI